MIIIKDIRYLASLCEQTQNKVLQNNIVNKKLYNILLDPTHTWTFPFKEYVADLRGYLEARFRNEKPEKPAYIRELHISPLEEVQIRLSEVYENRAG